MFTNMIFQNLHLTIEKQARVYFNSVKARKYQRKITKGFEKYTRVQLLITQRFVRALRTVNQVRFSHDCLR